MPVTPDKIRQFERRVKALQASAEHLAKDVRARVNAVVNEHRRRIKELLDQQPLQQAAIAAADVPRLKTQLRREVDEMLAEAIELVQAAEELAWSKGFAAGQELAASLGLEASFFAPSLALRTIATGYTADLIRSIADDLMPKVNGVIARGVLGNLSPYAAMQEIDVLLGRGGQRGVSYQAERIVRTEVQRVYSIALDTQVQALAAMAEHPQKLRKQWVAGPFRQGRREEHQQIDGQTVPVAEPFKLPDGTRLMYPRDPAGPPHQTINCGCSWIIDPDSLADAMH
ncbi:phage head morphogenesis protein [bacterium]|nr:phage head morphogenesis protein [bacterium]